MYTFSYTITDPVGIHARPAGQLAKEAGGFKSKIMICKGEKKAEARRLIAVMGLGVKTGETVCFEIEGADESEAGAQIEAFCKANL